jgi:regulator of RNase E activity RraA
VSHCLIYDDVAPLNPDVVPRLALLPTAALSDSMQRFSGTPGLLPVPGSVGKNRLSGPALTVRTRPGDNLVVHKAVDLARPGDVVVVDAGGHPDRAIIGELLCRYAQSRGIAGIVVDGAVRDVGEIAALGLPVFARAVSHLGPYKTGPGEIRGPVTIGGTPVMQGDVVVGDENGVVVVPRPRLQDVAAAAEALVDRERAAVEAIDAGRWDRAWVDRSLSVRLVSRSIDWE